MFIAAKLCYDWLYSDTNLQKSIITFQKLNCTHCMTPPALCLIYSWYSINVCLPKCLINNDWVWHAWNR